MADFGFALTPQVILQAQAEQGRQSLGDVLQSAAQLASHRLQQQTAQMQLADLGRQQLRQQTLQGIYSQNADNLASLPAALYRGGFGPEAQETQEKTSQLATALAQRDKLFREGRAADAKMMGDLFSGVKDQADWDTAKEQLPDHYKVLIPDKYDPTLVQRFSNFGMTAKERADVTHQGVVTDETHRHNTAMESRLNKLADVKIHGGNLVGPDDLTDEALDAMATQYATTGQLPQFGMGKAGAALRVKIANRAAELNPDLDLAGAKGTYGANTASLKKLQTTADAIDAFEKTAGKNLDIFLNQAKQVSDFGAPFLNAPARDFAKKVAGSANMASFEAARQTAVNEIGKVLSGGTGAGAITNSAREEVRELLPPDASWAQIQAAAKVLKQDMANRKESTQGQLNEMRTRMSPKSGTKKGLTAAEAAELKDLEVKYGGK